MAALPTESNNNNNSNNKKNAVKFIELTNVGVKGENFPHQYQYYFSLWQERAGLYLLEEQKM